MIWMTKFYFGSSTSCKIITKQYNYLLQLFHIHSDASNTEIACVFGVKGRENICCRNLTDLEKAFSSAWHKLEAMRFSFPSLIKQFENNFFGLDENIIRKPIKFPKQLLYDTALNKYSKTTLGKNNC